LVLWAVDAAFKNYDCDGEEGKERAVPITAGSADSRCALPGV
jgi:hypothetical protein